jgi:type II secretory pathway component PulJ
MRKQTSHAFVNEFLVYSLVALCFSGSIGLGTVWMRHQISIVANANRALESQIADLQRHLQERDAEIASEQDPAALERRNQEWRLGLQPAAASQVQRVTENPVDHLNAKQGRELFEKGSPRVSFSIALGR